MQHRAVQALLLFVLCLSFAISQSSAEDRVPASQREESKAVLPPAFSERYEYHDVCGCCTKDIECDMAKKAITAGDGNGYDSLTTWKITWDYGYKRGSDYCSVDSFKVTAGIIIHLPRWVCTGSQPDALKNKWEVYIKKLTRHENGHRDMVKKAVEDLTNEVSRMAPSRTCGEIDRKVQALCRERMKNLDKDQQTYDDATGHGFADGAMFP